jgi:hypothetical protein
MEPTLSAKVYFNSPDIYRLRSILVAPTFRSGTWYGKSFWALAQIYTPQPPIA